MTEKIERTHLKVFGAKADESEIAQFGSTADKNSTQYTKNLNTIQNLPAYSHGWQKAVEGDAAPVLEEVNGLQYLFSSAIAYLYQQGGTTQAWHPDTTYYNGSVVGKIASPTGPIGSLLGKEDAPRITLVYRSRTNDNQGKALPNDFLSDANWDWVDVIQPQGINLLALNIPIGSFMYHCDDGLHPHEVPINCAIADGRTYTRPDGSTGTTLNLMDRFPLGAKGSSVGALEGDWDYTFSGTTNNTDINHEHNFRIAGNTGGTSLTRGQMPAHTHRTYTPNHRTDNIGSDGSKFDDVGVNTDWYGTDSSSDNMYPSGGNQAHAHHYDQTLATAWMNQNNPHNHTLLIADANNRPPYIKLLPIQRFF